MSIPVFLNRIWCKLCGLEKTVEQLSSGGSGGSGGPTIKVTQQTINAIEGTTVLPSSSINGDIHIVNLIGSTLYYKYVGGSWSYVGNNTNIISVTVAELTVLIAANGLFPGTTYEITDAHKNKISGPNSYPLFDDGNNLGTVIYLNAITRNSLEKHGTGIFYNPIHAASASFNLTTSIGTFGIFHIAHTYNINDTTIWGNYVWKYLGGLIEEPILQTALDTAIWEKQPYTNTNLYKKVEDYIEYDIISDRITRRRNIKYNIDVINLYISIADNSIGTMFWHDGITGIKNNVVVNSIAELCNFKTALIENNVIINLSTVRNNMMYKGNFTGNYLDRGTITNNSFNITNINSNRLIFGIFNGNEVDNGNMILNFISYGSINNNTLNKTTSTVPIINNNVLSQNASINDNTLTSGFIERNILSGSTVNNCIITESGFYSNNLDNTSSVIGLSLLSSSAFNNNNLETLSKVTSCSFTSSHFKYNNLVANSEVIRLTMVSSSEFNDNIVKGIVDFNSVSYSAKMIETINFKNSMLIPDVNAATIIYFATHKEITTALTTNVVYIKYTSSLGTEVISTVTT